MLQMLQNLQNVTKRGLNVTRCYRCYKVFSFNAINYRHLEEKRQVVTFTMYLPVPIKNLIINYIKGR